MGLRFFPLGFLLLVLMSVPVWPQQRIVSISPVITEILHALSATPALVGVTTLCNYPPEVQSLPKVGDSDPSIESVVLLQPDMVIGLGNDPRLKSQMEELNIRSHIFESPRTLRDIFTLIEEVGNLIGKQAEAKQLLERMDRELMDLSESRPQNPPNVLVVIWFPPLITVGEGTFIYEMVEVAGGHHVVAVSDIDFPRVTEEILVYSQPEVIVVTHPSLKTAVLKDEIFLRTPAVQKNRVIDAIDPDLIVRAGPRFIEGIRELRKVFVSVQ